MTASFRMARNSLATFLAQLLSQGLRAVYVVLVGRYLSEADFGFYSFALAICLVVTILATLGLETILVRELAALRQDDAARRARQRSLLGSVLAYELVLSLGVCVLLWGITRWRGEEGARQTAFLLLGGGLILRQLSESLMGVLRGHEHMEYELVFSAVEGLGLVGLVLVFHALGLGFMGVFWAYGLTYALQFLIGLGFVMRVFFLPSFAALRSDGGLVAKAFPVGLARLTSSLTTNAGPLLLPLLRSELEAGIYGAAYQPLKGLFLVTRSLGVGVLPVFSQLYSDRDEGELARSVDTSVRFTTIIILPLAAGLFAFPELVLRILYGAKYAAGAEALRALSVVIVLTFLNTLFTNLAIAVHRQKALGWGRAVSTILILALLLWLTPRLGPLGPALALLMGELTLCVILALVLGGQFRRFPLLRSLARPLLAGLAMTLVLWLGRAASPWAIIPLGGAVYGASLILVKAVVRQDAIRALALGQALSKAALGRLRPLKGKR